MCVINNLSERRMELESTLSGKPLLKTSSTSEYVKRYCKPYHTKWVRSKGAILILAWSFLAMSVVYYYSISISRGSVSMKVNNERPKGSELIGMGSFLLIGGWLADAYFGRYKAIRSGLWIMWIGSFLSACSLVIAKFNTAYKYKGADRWVSLFSEIVMGSGFGLFQSNIIQFGIDQLSDASSTEITSFITCYTLILFISGFVMDFSAHEHCAPDYVGVLVLTVCLTLAVCIHFLFGHVLVKEQTIQNPLPLIWKVIRYSIKNHNLQQRFSSFEDHSFLDIAKMVYAGPFSSEQVEDVKAFFRVMVVIIACVLPHSGTTSIFTIKDSLLPHLQNIQSTSSLDCYRVLTLTHANFIFTIALVLLYLIIIQPLFYNCIPKVSITTKFIIALALYLIRIMALLGIESASYQYQLQENATNISRCYTLQNGHHTTININSKWVVVPEIANGLSLFILILAGLEFVCAQAPFNMKGFVFGITYALFGCCTLLQTVLLVPFHYVEETVWEKAPLTCGIWYFLIQVVLTLLCFVLMIVVIKRYKRRTRISATQSEWQESYSVNSN